MPEPYLEVDRELQRCDVKSVEDLERVSRSTIKFKFPAIMPKKATTILVLKSPKNESSNRKIYLSKTVVNELRKVAAEQEEHKNLMKDQYNDMGMVVAQINGHPYEQNIISKHFKKLIKDHGLRPVVFHSLRHTSTSVKLKLSKGNIKAVQGDTGHAEARMVTDTYAHGFDADRKLIAHEMDAGLFDKVNKKPEAVEINLAEMERVKTMLRAHPELQLEFMKGMGGAVTVPVNNT